MSGSLVVVALWIAFFCCVVDSISGRNFRSGTKTEGGGENHCKVARGLQKWQEKAPQQPLQYLDGTPGEPPSAAETWLFKNVADKAASRERGLAVEEMRRVIMQAATPSPGVDAAVVGAPASTSVE